jgi:hypothetical protein
MRRQFKAKAEKTRAGKSEFLIFCDLDGVLSDFDAHAKANNKFTATGQPKWNELDRKWWQSMPAYKGAKTFYDTLRSLGRTRMLTAPILDAGCFRGKAEWVKKFRGNRFLLLDLLICPAVDKELLARPNHILVDDRQKNIDEWIAAGGIGILHKGDYADTLKRVQEAMEKYRNGPKTPVPLSTNPAAGKHEVFIGTNGVLADFAGHAQAQGKMTPDGKVKWEQLDTAWWKSIPAYEGAGAFYDAVRKIGETRLLTGPVPIPEGFEGDAEWTMKFRASSGKFALKDLIICRSQDKNLLARPDKILIDDRQENIDAWIKAGGIGILHKGDYADTLRRLQEAVAGPKTGPKAAPSGP